MGTTAFHPNCKVFDTNAATGWLKVPEVNAIEASAETESNGIEVLHELRYN